KKLFQPFSISRAFPVDFAKYPKFSNGLCNREANLVTEFGATFGIPNREATLEERYGSFLLEVSKKVNWHKMSEEEQKHQKQLEEAREEARTDLENFETRIETRWANYKAVHNIPNDTNEWRARDAWERRYEYYSEHTQRIDAVALASAELWTYIAQMTPEEE